MKQGSTLFLKTVIVLIGVGVLALCIFVLPIGLRSTTTWFGYRMVLAGMYIPAIPFFIGLFEAFSLLRLIEQNRSFSRDSIRALKRIKYCGFTISALYILLLPFMFLAAQFDDAPGVAALGMIFTFAPLSIGVIATIMEHMFGNAMHIKSENELMV